MRWILLWTIPLVQDWLLDLLISSPACYYWATDAPFLVNDMNFGNSFAKEQEVFKFVYSCFSEKPLYLLLPWSPGSHQIQILLSVCGFWSHTQRSVPPTSLSSVEWELGHPPQEPHLQQEHWNSQGRHIVRLATLILSSWERRSNEKICMQLCCQNI